MTRKLTVEEVLKAEEDWNGREAPRAMGAAATAFFSAKMDMGEFLRQMRSLCDKAIREGGAE